MSNEETPITEEVLNEVPAVEPEAVPALEPEPVVVTQDVPVEVAAAPEAAPAPAPKPKKVAARSGVGIVVSGGDSDDVRLDACVFKNMFARKSLSIHHVQRKLAELGYRDAVSDKDGWYGDLTKLAVAAFQKANNLGDSGVLDAATLHALFADEPFINVIA
jgi:peptidoglycan hydrolase-like protein with peptidoglycan-binding domain